MRPKTAHDLIITPTLRWLGKPYDSPEARLMLVAIGLVESGFVYRAQVKGPARGLWQFERSGGAAEFEQHPQLGDLRVRATELGFTITRGPTMAAIAAGADVLACIMARGLLWIDPAPLPRFLQPDEAYLYYLRRWRPGKPSRSRWDASYQKALEVVTG